MNEQLSATIIPFPIRIRSIPAKAPVMGAAPVVRAPTPQRTAELSNSSQRLAQALANLAAALADQKDATQRWKAAIDDLAAKMRTLGEIGTVQKKLG